MSVCVCVCGGEGVVDDVRVKVRGHNSVKEEDDERPVVLAAVNAPSSRFLISCGKTN